MAAFDAGRPIVCFRAMQPLPTLAEIESIEGFIDGIVAPTPQYAWPMLSHRCGCELWVKHENFTVIGSFKVRGALQYLAQLRAREPDVRGVIAATRGNFGQAVAFAARRLGLTATIVVPRNNNAAKNAAMRALGAELVEAGDDFQAALEQANKMASELGRHFVPSFHRDLVEGCAVSALHFLRCAPALTRVYVPIGLGSGIGAMMAARDALGLPTRIVGVAADAAPGIALSFAAGRVVPHAASTRVADGLACSTPNPEALGHILHGTERVMTVTDDEIEAAMRHYFSDTHCVAEGAAGAGLAAVLKDSALNAGQRIGVVLTGGNVDRADFARVLGA